MKRRAADLILLAALALAPACRRSAPARPPASETREVRDGLGRTLRVPGAVRRVVSLAPSSTEILFALGAGPLVVGIDRYSDFPAATAAIEKVGADLDPSVERILALRPDLVFTATSANTQQNVEAMERAGLVVYVSSPKRLEQILADIGGIAGAIGRADAGAALTDRLRARIDAVRGEVAGAPIVKALAVVWADPLLVAARETHVDDLLRAAGAENAASDATGYPTYSVERVIAAAPAVIVYGTHAKPGAPAPPVPDALASLRTVPAVRDGRVHAVDGDLLFRPGPRVVEAVEALAALLHPRAPKDAGR